MKNMKVRTKLNLILVLVILLVALGGTVSVKDMEDVKDKALETMEASSRQSYDDSIKEQVEVVISLLSEINDAYKAGTYTLDEAKKIAADEVRQMRYGEAGYFWIDQSDGTNVVLLGSDTEGTNRMETKDAKRIPDGERNHTCSSGRRWRIHRFCIPETRRDKTFPEAFLQ